MEALEEKGQEGLEVLPENGWGSGVRECVFEQSLSERWELGIGTWGKKVLQVEGTAGAKFPRQEGLGAFEEEAEGEAVASRPQLRQSFLGLGSSWLACSLEGDGKL